jgi:hypothetical protein
VFQNKGDQEKQPLPFSYFFSKLFVDLQVKNKRILAPYPLSQGNYVT